MIISYSIITNTALVKRFTERSRRISLSIVDLPRSYFNDIRIPAEYTNLIFDKTTLHSTIGFWLWLGHMFAPITIYSNLPPLYKMAVNLPNIDIF